MENKRKTFRHKAVEWLFVIAMTVGMTPMTASAATVPHTHDSWSFTPEVGQGVIEEDRSRYLADDETVNNNIIVKGSGVTVNICLNGHTLDLNGWQILVDDGATLNIYDCAGGGGKIINGSGKTYGSSTATKGGAFYVRGANLNIYGGTIEGNTADWGGAIFIDGSRVSGISTVNMYGGTIRGNTAHKGGGGIEVEIGTGVGYGSYFNMYGGSIINNTVTNTDGTDPELHKGGGVYVADGAKMTIQSENNSAINITGNTVAGVMDNVYVRNNNKITVGTVAEGSRIGVSAYNIESSPSVLSYTVTSGYGGNISNDSIKYFYMDNLHSSATYALVLDNNELAITKHTHNWQYEQGSSANQIRAYCANTSHQCAFRQGAYEPTLTLNAQNVTYSGITYNGISYDTEEETKWTYAGLTMPTVNYKGTEVGDTPYESTTPPTNAGTYEASITVGTGENTVTAKKGFTIERKSIEGAEITLNPGNQGHTGSEITQTIQSVKLTDNTILLEADYEQDTSSVASATDIGTYTVKINGVKNYTDSATAEWHIIPQAHTLTVQSDGNGTVGIQGYDTATASIESLVEVTLTATPNSGYRFKQWVVSPSGVMTITDNKFTMPECDVTVRAEFEVISSGDSGGGSGSSTDTPAELDTSYRKLRLHVPKSTRTTNVLKWTAVSDADGYVIYGNKCNTKGKTYQMVKQVTIKNGSTTTWTDKKLTSGTYYKYYIKAYKLVDGKKVWLAKSKVVHSTTTGGKYGNAKSVKVNKTAVSLAVGKTFTIKAKQIVKDLPIKKHTEIKFESSNSKVASVTSKGVIKAKKKGTCYIYVYAQNGMYKRIKVTVK